MDVSARILIFGHDSMLLRTRCLILKKARFQVRTTTELEGVARILFEEKIDLLILCRSVEKRERKEAVRVAHDLRPEMKTLVLSDDLPKDHSSVRDTVVDYFVSPEALLSLAVELAIPVALGDEDLLRLAGEPILGI